MHQTIRAIGLGAALCLVPGLALAQTTARVARQSVLLEQPRGDSVVVTSLAPGTVVEVHEVRGEWYRVTLPPLPGAASGTVQRGWLRRSAFAAPPVAQPGQRGPTTTSSRQTRSGTSPRARIGARAYAVGDLESMTARKSFDAIAGTSRLAGFGAGLDVLDVWSKLFVRVAVSRTSKSGDRAFVFNGQAVSLNVPMKIHMTPVELGAGWRVPLSRLAPYAGGGALILRYSEKSSFAGAGDDLEQTNVGYTAFGGVEFLLSKGLIVGAEAQYRGVPHAIGKAPVSQDFGETDLGGFAVRVLFGIRR